MLFAIALAAAPAWAECPPPPSAYLCAGVTTVLDGVITSVGEAETELHVSAVHGAPPDGGAPAHLVMPRLHGDAVGRRSLVLEGGTPSERLVANEKGEIWFGFAGRDTFVPADEVVEMILSPDCARLAERRGLGPGPCHDTFFPMGCCSAGSGVVFAVALPLLLRRRRTPSRPDGEG